MNNIDVKKIYQTLPSITTTPRMHRTREQVGPAALASLPMGAMTVGVYMLGVSASMQKNPAIISRFLFGKNPIL